MNAKKTHNRAAELDLERLKRRCDALIADLEDEEPISARAATAIDQAVRHGRRGMKEHKSYKVSEKSPYKDDRWVWFWDKDPSRVLCWRFDPYSQRWKERGHRLATIDLPAMCDPQEEWNWMLAPGQEGQQVDKHKLIVVLEDGQTYSEVDGCYLARVTMAGLTGLDAGDNLEKIAGQGEVSAMVSVKRLVSASETVSRLRALDGEDSK